MPELSKRHNRVNLSSFYEGFRNHLIRIGTGYHYADLYRIAETKNLGIDPKTGLTLPPRSPVIDVTDTPYVFSPEGDRRNWSIYLQDIWNFASNWELTAGIRFDEYSDFGKTTNPRLALVWQTRPELTTKLLYGQAFRAPSFQQMNNVNNPALLGNPNLKPETIETWELAFDYRATDNLHLALNLFAYDITDKILFEPIPDAQSGGMAQNTGRQKGQGFEFEASWKITKKSSLLLNYAFQDSTDENNDHEVGFAPQHQVYLRNDWLLFPNWFLNTQLNSNVWAPEVDRNNWYVFLQDSWQISSDWEFTAGIRYDEYSDFGSTTNPRAALVWQAQSNLTTKLLFGSAFRAPVFNELYISNNALQMGNPNLEPETIKTWELAFDYKATKTLNFALNLFHYDIKDKILYVLDDPNATEVSMVAQNAGMWAGNGLELETRWQISPKANLLFNYAFQKSEDDKTGQELGNSPEHQAYLRTDWLLFPNWFLDTQVNWAGDWSRKPGDPRKKVDDSTTVDLTLRHKDSNQNRWNLAVGVRNLFDEDVRIPSFIPDTDGLIYIPNDYPLYKRSYWAELRYRF
jgi:outer membrane receptor for ferrienterochelin and colicin